MGTNDLGDTAKVKKIHTAIVNKNKRDGEKYILDALLPLQQYVSTGPYEHVIEWGDGTRDKIS